MINESKTFTLIKECEDYITQARSSHGSINKFFGKKSMLNGKYNDLLKKNYDLLISSFSFLPIVSLIFIFIQIIITAVYIDNDSQLSLLISECFSFLIILLLTILLFIKKIQTTKVFPFLIVWIIYLDTFTNMVLLTYKYAESSSQDVLLHKFYFNLIMGHVIFSLFLNANMSLHFAHYIIIAGLDILLLIVLNISSTFYYQSFSLMLFALYTFLQSYKTEITQKKIYDFSVKKYYNSLINDEIIQSASIGICLCKEDFSIQKTNLQFSSKMSDLMISKEKEEDNNNDLTKANLNINLLNLKLRVEGNTNTNTNPNPEKLASKVTDSTKDRDHLCGLGGLLPNNNKVEWYLNTIDLIKKFDDSSDKKNIKIPFNEALTIENNMYLENGQKQQMEHFNSLGRFKMRKNTSLYCVKWKRVYVHKNSNSSSTIKQSQSNQPIKNKHSSNISDYSNCFNYKFIFTEITNNRKYDRVKVEQIYQKLILAKVSHEFNRPIAVIQSKMDAFMNQYKDSLSKEAYYFFNEVKYYAETILISVRDLIEYINIHSTNTAYEQQEKSKYPLIDLRDYCENLLVTYIGLMGRSLGAEVGLDESLENGLIEIDIKRLNQIIANLISNAIKNTENDDRIIIRIHKMSNHDIKHFEFDANKNMIVNENDSEDDDRKRFFDSSNEFREEEQFEVDFGLVIEIEDNGSGINSTLLKDINSEGGTFYRLDTNETKINNAEGYAQCKGLGSGLKICKKLADEIGGKLKCELKRGIDNQGTIFKLFFKTEITMMNSNTNNQNDCVPNDISAIDDDYKMRKYS